MHRKYLSLCLSGLALSFLHGLLPSQVLADEDAQRQRLQVFNRLTGTQTLSSQLKALTADPQGTRQLIAAALPLLNNKENPVQYPAALLLAQASAELKDFKASESFYRRCMTEAAKLHSVGRLLESYGGLIEFFYDNKKFADAARVCQELLELKPDDGKERVLRRAVSTPLDDTDFEEVDVTDATDRLRPVIFQMLIQAIAKQGKYDQALQMVDTLVKTQGGHWQDHALKGWVLREAGKFDAAVKVYENVLDQVNSDKNLKKDVRDRYADTYRYTLSNVYVDLKRIDKATDHLQALLKKKPDDPGLNNDLGYIWADHDMKLDEAEKLIRKALELDRKRRKANPDLRPEDDHDNGAYLDSLGWVLFKQKKFKEAKVELLRATEDKNSQHIEIYDHLGDVLSVLGEREGAIAAWQTGLKIAADNRRDQERKLIVQKKLEKAK